MKNILTLILLFISISIFAQSGDALIGTYMTDKSEGMVDIIKKGSKYYGTLTWTKTPGKLDSNNPDAKQKTDKLAGKEILKDFVFDGKDLWHEGTIYDPKNGTFSALGNIVFSKVEFKGIAGKFSEPITLTGASNFLKQFSEIRAAIL
jgi:uncharacterized protein (DUF2147 family)